MPEAIAQALALSETSPYGFFLRDQIDILLTECLDSMILFISVYRMVILGFLQCFASDQMESV